MKCVICKSGETAPGKTSILLERGKTTLVFKNVPADVCQNCGEGYMDEDTTDRLLQMAEEAIRLGVQVDIRQYVAA
ncbi:MAG: type II toxin-antitoxin system MqsA family antitoxin [Ktedonobacteraceae bacterium]